MRNNFNILNYFIEALLVVSLKQVFINDFVELRSPLRWFRWNGFLNPEPANGEIAIIVNAFEIGKGQTADFSPTGKENARVVYFSDDVWEGQFLNVSNLGTIYGPLTYDGSPFILDLYIVEMDTPGEQLRQLLSNLAAIGSTFYPPAAPIAGPMAQLAGTLIKDDQDDRAYHFTAEFKNYLGGDPDVNTALLLAGDYVFIREEDRYKITDWNKLKFDQDVGRVVYSEDMEGKSHCTKSDKNYPADCYYRENSYVVVEINTAASAIKNDVTQMIYKELSASVFSNAAPIFKTAIPEDALERLSVELIKTRSAANINKQLTILENLAGTTGKKAEQSASLDRFINLWTMKDNDGNLVHQFNEVDSGRIEQRLARIISKCESGDKNKVLSIMKKLRGRSVNIDTDTDVIRALSC